MSVQNHHEVIIQPLPPPLPHPSISLMLLPRETVQAAWLLLLPQFKSHLSLETDLVLSERILSISFISLAR